MSIQDWLPRWQSHKLVRATKIAEMHSDDTMVLTATDSRGQPIRVKPADRMFARYRPVAGDYYVVHTDGHATVMPAEAFEAGYHPL